MLEIGTLAPNFTLTNQNGDNASLADYKGKWVVLYFYPRALTPGCIIQAEGMTSIKAELDALNVETLAVSADETAKLKRFEEKKSLNIQLLGDTSEDKTTLKLYEAWGEKKFLGKTFDGIHRITYIINPNGEVAHTMPKVKTKSHHEDVLNWLKSNA
jgi:peroxiredoxin Q/BCP